MAETFIGKRLLPLDGPARLGTVGLQSGDVLNRLGEECRHVPHEGGSHRPRDLVPDRFEQAKDDDRFPIAFPGRGRGA